MNCFVVFILFLCQYIDMKIAIGKNEKVNLKNDCVYKDQNYEKGDKKGL